MLRYYSLATLALVFICLAIGASIALADESGPQEAVPANGARAIEAVDPNRRMIDDSLATVEGDDIYEFDFTVTTDDANPEFEQQTDILEI